MFERAHQLGYAAFVPVLAVSALLSPVAAMAAQEDVFILAQPSPVRSEQVSYADLNLSSASGVRRLQLRIDAAVDRVCLREISRDGLQAREFYQCEAGAWQRARPHIDAAVARVSEIAFRQSATALTIAVSAS